LWAEVLSAFPGDVAIAFCLCGAASGLIYVTPSLIDASRATLLATPHRQGHQQHHEHDRGATAITTTPVLTAANTTKALLILPLLLATRFSTIPAPGRFLSCVGRPVDDLFEAGHRPGVVLPSSR
jgi:hypothetical protein